MMLARVVILLFPTLSLSLAHDVGRPRFSWDTLPVFFHAANASGPWSEAAAKQIARYPMATNEKDHAMGRAGKPSEEIAGPAACRQISKVSENATDTFFYLNSVIDWKFNFHLHDLMMQNPEWRLKNTTGQDFLMMGGLWVYNMTNADMRAAWVKTCVDAVQSGCTGCFIDQANVNQARDLGLPETPVYKAYSDGHMQGLKDLQDELTPTGNYAIMNHLGVKGYDTTTMMIEDWGNSEFCIQQLQKLSANGFTVQAHAGRFVAGKTCVDGDTNSMAAFLIGAGKYSYYHCTVGWACNPDWPAASDAWLDWLPQYDAPLGAPLADGVKGADGIWRRSFTSGTTVAFDPKLQNGTIAWANGLSQTGVPQPEPIKACKWESV